MSAGRQEFVQYLPEATQGVIVQPLGGDGVMVVGTDTLRGLSRLDQVRGVEQLQGWVLTIRSPCHMLCPIAPSKHQHIQLARIIPSVIRLLHTIQLVLS